MSRKALFLGEIKIKYEYDINNSMQELNMEHIVKRVIIKNTWKDLKVLLGYKNSLLINKLFKRHKALCFIIKSRYGLEEFELITEVIKKLVD
jgi:hypothetical protein